MNTPIMDWIREKQHKAAMDMVRGGQVSPTSVMGQAIIAQSPIDTSMSNPTLGMVMPQGIGATAPASALSAFGQGITPQAPAAPQAPAKPSMAAGSGVHALSRNLNSGLDIHPAPPKRPTDLAPAPSMNDVIKQGKQDGDVLKKFLGNPSLAALFGGLGSGIGTVFNGIGQGIGGIASGIGHGVEGLGHGIESIFGANPQAAQAPQVTPQAPQVQPQTDPQRVFGFLPVGGSSGGIFNGLFT